MRLPEIGDKDGVVAYARSFNAYEYHGSFEAAAKVSKEKPRLTLEDLRTELFMAWRASNHSGSDYVMRLYAELKPLLEQWPSQ